MMSQLTFSSCRASNRLRLRTKLHAGGLELSTLNIRTYSIML